jgi:16S rRNA (uracil1498-N3)-methyltransferase
MREGEDLHVFDGKGHLYLGAVTLAKRSATVFVREMVKIEPVPTAQLHIAIAPTKNIDRVEWFLEKASEIGVHTITPVICQRSERRELRIDRLQKVILSAAKQSLHLHLPVLNEAMSYKQFIKIKEGQTDKKFIAFCEEKTTHLRDSFAPSESILVLIGPEGDFTAAEVAMAKEAGYIPVSLGESRLRTETAGMMVSAVFNLKAG